MLCAGAAVAQQKKDGADPILVNKAIEKSWTTVAPDWQARLDQDETQKACSQYRNSPPKDVAAAIVAREQAAIVYPPDGKLMGDWKNGEKLAESGYGGRFTDYPAAPAQRRQLLCLPSAGQGAGQLRHAGAEPPGVRQDPQVFRGRYQGRLRAHLQSACGPCVRKHATIGCQQVPYH